MVNSPFFPSSSLQLEQVVLELQAVVFVLRTVVATAPCPDCGQLSDRVHSRYRRRLTDLPAQGRAIRVELLARRFFCPAADCPRRIFTERLPEIVAVRGRTTARLHHAHCDIGLALGGEAGARLAARLAMPTSPDTLLRRVRNTQLPNRPFVRVLGVDDWAFRKGHRYGTILCDLEQRCPVDLLPERSAEALCDWLKEHPEVEIISRDRADDYIRGATTGAPQAVQVADRWHLLRNLRDALKGAVDRHHAEVQAAAREVLPGAPGAEPSQRGEEIEGPVAPVSPVAPPRTERQQVRRQRREQRYEQVLALHHQGLSQRAIADQLAMHRSTVKRFVEAGSFPERASRRCARCTDHFVGYLKQRWAEGCRNAAQLFTELRARGFGGSYFSVRRQLARWREATPPGEAAPRGKATPPGVIERPSARRVSWLLLMDPADRKVEEQAFLDRLQSRCPELRAAAELGRDFRSMVREKRESAWDGWLERASASDAVKELRAFAEGLKKDEAAVRAALRLQWSNGQVEGQVNRLKVLSTDYSDRHSPSLGGYTTRAAMCGAAEIGQLARASAGYLWRNPMSKSCDSRRPPVHGHTRGSSDRSNFGRICPTLNANCCFDASAPSSLSASAPLPSRGTAHEHQRPCCPGPNDSRSTRSKQSPQLSPRSLGCGLRSPVHATTSPRES